MIRKIHVEAFYFYELFGKSCSGKTIYQIRDIYDLGNTLNNAKVECDNIYF